MRKIFVVIAVTIFLFLCEQKSKIEKAVEEIPLEIKVERFDKAFFETAPADLPKLKQPCPKEKKQDCHLGL